jgi:hypothetical protein
MNEEMLQRINAALLKMHEALTEIVGISAEMKSDDDDDDDEPTTKKPAAKKASKKTASKKTATKKKTASKKSEASPMPEDVRTALRRLQKATKDPAMVKKLLKKAKATGVGNLEKKYYQKVIDMANEWAEKAESE